jgi:serine/threonine-protein kinase
VITSEENRAFLQERVALFYKAMFFISLIGNTLDLGSVLSGHGIRAHIVLSVITTAMSFALWRLCRRGTRSVAFSRAVEAFGLFATAFFIGITGRYLVAAVGPEIAANIPDTSAQHPLIDGYLSMMIVLGAALMVAIRAAIVPTSTKRTIWLTALLGLPFIVPAAIMYPPFDGGLVLALPTTVDQLRLPAMMCVWWGFTIITSAIISQVIYGLRAEITEARQMGQYVLERKLGEGGMGEVYRARHGMMRRPTAIKLLPPDRAGHAAVARFEREVRLTARLTHPNTITIFDYGRTADGVFYYAMELLDGATLEEIVRSHGPQPPSRVAHVLSMVCGALSEAHSVGLIHRDIKPANVMLCSQGGEQDVVKVLDFGLVKQLEVDRDVQLTGANTVAGTPLYMAPESIRNAADVDARADIYAVGAVGYFMLTGTNVFESDSMIEVCSMHLHEPPQSPSDRLGSAVPEALETALLTCLEKDPAARPQSAVELRELIDAVEVPSWDAHAARSWWKEHGECLRDERHTDSSGTGKTIAIDHARDLSEVSAESPTAAR